jgi:hypothetical protein
MQIVLASRIDRGGGPTGAGAAKFRRDLSSVRRSGPDSACHGHTQLDDRVGCSVLFLGSCCLSRPVRSGDFSVALPCMERGDARDCLDPSVSGLRPTIGTDGCSGLHWRPLAGDHSFPRRVFPASIRHCCPDVVPRKRTCDLPPEAAAETCIAERNRRILDDNRRQIAEAASASSRSRRPPRSRPPRAERITRWANVRCALEAAV